MPVRSLRTCPPNGPPPAGLWTWGRLLLMVMVILNLYSSISFVVDIVHTHSSWLQTYKSYGKYQLHFVPVKKTCMGMQMKESDINIGIIFNFFGCTKLWHFVLQWLWPTSVAQCDSSGPVAKVNYSGLFHIWILSSVEDGKIPAITRQQFLIGFWSTTVILCRNSQKAGSEPGLLSHTYKTTFPNMWPGEKFPLLPSFLHKLWKTYSCLKLHLYEMATNNMETQFCII